MSAFVTWMNPENRHIGERVVAIGLLTRRDLSLLGPTFDRAWPVEDVRSFDGLLEAIDQADRKPKLKNQAR